MPEKESQFFKREEAPEETQKEKEIEPEEKAEKVKEKHLKEIENEVERITDALGKPIDPGIKETVVSLKVWEFPTYQSCEGHSAEHPEKIEVEERESITPWVRVVSPEPENWEKDKLVQKEWKKENLKHQLKMVELLDEFYQERKASFDVRLHIEQFGIYGGFTITNQGSNIIEGLPKREQEKKRTLYQKEMQEFAKFLKEKYLKEE